MKEVTLTLTTMANGGAAMGRHEGRPIFVPFTIPGEKARVRITVQKNRFAHAELVAVLEASPDRVEPRCPHFGVCGGCHFQHIAYDAQLNFKQEITIDQLQRIGGFKDVPVRPTLANPMPWDYGIEANLSPTPTGGLGLWSPTLHKVIDIDVCHIIHPHLVELLEDIDLELPGLRTLTLRVGDDGALLAALEVEDMDPPQLETDFPVSVAIVLPDDTAASLVGDNFLVQSVKGKDFRVSPGCFFQPSLEGAALLVDTVLSYAELTGTETVIEGYSGVGMLTAFLSPKAGSLIGIEVNEDAVADAAVNLDETGNVSLYEGFVEEVLPALEVTADVIVVNPPAAGLSAAVVAAIVEKSPSRLVYVSSDVATLARDGKQLRKAGYQLVEVQPVDVAPQTFQIDTVSLWQ